jgi:hypothetical protein
LPCVQVTEVVVVRGGTRLSPHHGH